MRLLWTIAAGFLACGASGFAVMFALTSLAGQARRAWLDAGPPFAPLNEVPNVWVIVIPIALAAFAGALIAGAIFARFNIPLGVE